MSSPRSPRHGLERPVLTLLAAGHPPAKVADAAGIPAAAVAAIAGRHGWPSTARIQAALDALGGPAPIPGATPAKTGRQLLDEARLAGGHYAALADRIRSDLDLLRQRLDARAAQAEDDRRTRTRIAQIDDQLDAARRRVNDLQAARDQLARDQLSPPKTDWAAIRAWARRQGIPVPKGGRLRADLVAQYRQDHT